MIEPIVITKDHEAHCGGCIKYSTVNVLRCWILKNMESLENRANIKISITFCPKRKLDKIK